MTPLLRIGVSLLVVTVVSAAPRSPATDDLTVLVLNRIGFGARPGDVERVRAIGLDRYVEQQLHPDNVPDAAMRNRLERLPTTRMSSREIAEKIELPQLEARREKKGGEAPGPVDQRANAVLLELAEQKVLRAVFSERQLQEVLTDFWFNHFNVDARKGPDRFMLTEYERDAIRPRVLGRFRDLLGAVAQSPAMLFYLDNWMSNSRKGLNENYARELMELHTLGVDGGYTQEDIVEVARAFTGWTIDRPRQGGGFVFRPALHDQAQKVVLGHVIKAGGGQSDGEQVLDILARHPSTARFVATKLVRRFVSDTPPPTLVDRAAKRFRDTEGDLREVMRTILTSREFLSLDKSDAKLKTPLEFVVSALRATGAEVNDALPLVRALQQLGMPPYQCQPPTGYKDAADAWINAGALVDRMNFAVRLSSGRLPGVSFAATEQPEDLALRIGGPEFQKR